jgi:hypothetical protein
LIFLREKKSNLSRQIYQKLIKSEELMNRRKLGHSYLSDEFVANCVAVELFELLELLVPVVAFLEY